MHKTEKKWLSENKKNIKEGDWKSSDIDLSIKAALDFTEASSSELVFSLPVNVAER